MQRRATALLLHAQRRWQDTINTHLWTYAIRAANDSRNYAPTNEDDTCPMSKFCNTASVPKVQNQHHFGCPTYVLRKELQDHKKIRKWSDRTRIEDRKTNGSWEPTNNTFTLKDTYTLSMEVVSGFRGYCVGA